MIRFVWLLALLVLGGCWESDKRLISAASSVEPFGTNSYYSAYVQRLGSFADETPKLVIFAPLKGGGYIDFKAYTERNSPKSFYFKDIVPSEDELCRFYIRIQKELENRSASCDEPDFQQAARDSEPFAKYLMIDGNGAKYDYAVFLEFQWKDDTSYHILFNSPPAKQIRSLSEIDYVEPLVSFYKMMIRDVPMTHYSITDVQGISRDEAEGLLSKAGSLTPAPTPPRPPRVIPDTEPTEADMNRAVARTLAGAFMDTTIRKMGKCRKAEAYVYLCRYQYISVNDGWFTNANGKWYFKIAD